MLVLVSLHCGPVVDFTTLHPFDFDRNLFNFLVSECFWQRRRRPLYSVTRRVKTVYWNNWQVPSCKRIFLYKLFLLYMPCWKVVKFFTSLVVCPTLLTAVTEYEYVAFFNIEQKCGISTRCCSCTGDCLSFISLPLHCKWWSSYVCQSECVVWPLSCPS